jgi:hypothetical protein
VEDKGKFAWILRKFRWFLAAESSSVLCCFNSTENSQRQLRELLLKAGIYSYKTRRKATRISRFLSGGPDPDPKKLTI